MLVIVFVMLVIVVTAGLVLVYAAFPHRGQDVPAVPWLGEAMERATDAMPVVSSAEDESWSIDRR